MALRLGEETKTAMDSKGVSHTLHRLYDGTLRGGWVEKLENIRGSSWVADEAEVYGNAIIDNESVIQDNAKVFDDAVVAGDAWGGSIVKDEAVVCDNGRLVAGTAAGHSRICNNALTYHGVITDFACIKDDACVNGHGFVMCDYATVTGNAEVTECLITGHSKIRGNAKVSKTYIGGRAIIQDDAEIYGGFGSGHSYYDTIIKDSAVIEGNARVGDMSKNFDETKGVIIGGDSHVGAGEIVVDITLGVEDTPEERDFGKTIYDTIVRDKVYVKKGVDECPEPIVETFEMSDEDKDVDYGE